MKVPTYKSVFKKAIHGEELTPIEDFIAVHGPVMGDEKGHRKFRKDLQKVVDYMMKNAPLRVIHHYDDGLNK